ncbi:hypothetical protein TNCV_4554251 [Trichonephila clavipes]|nr:hypothetical protein TNCV_4554251 [Trichonephila clavipes]
MHGVISENGGHTQCGRIPRPDHKYPYRHFVELTFLLSLHGILLSTSPFVSIPSLVPFLKLDRATGGSE